MQTIWNLRLLIIMIVCLPFLNCNTDNTKTRKAVSHAGQITSKSKTEKVTSLNTPESFDSFFKKFQEESIFQKSRTKFPLMVKISGDEVDKVITKFIKQEEFKFTSIFIDKSAKMMVKKTVLNTYNVKIHLQIEDTGIEQNFIFSSKDGCWALVLVEDNSD